jgi:hypothetical protein
MVPLHPVRSVRLTFAGLDGLAYDSPAWINRDTEVTSPLLP